MNKVIPLEEHLPKIREVTIGNDPHEQWLASQLSVATSKAYESDLRQFLEFLEIAHIELNSSILEQITWNHAVSFRNKLSENNYQRSSINRKLASLRSFFSRCVAVGMLRSNPFDATLVSGYKVDRTTTGKSIEAKWLLKMLSMVDKTEDLLTKKRDRVILSLLIYGGLRRGELCNIHWDHFAKDNEHNILHLPDTKGGANQLIKIQSHTMAEIQDYQQVLKENSYPYEGKTPVLISLSRNNSHGRGMTPQSINLTVKKYAKKAGVPKNITAHMFRHSCCTLAIEGGAKPTQVQSHLRHKDIKTTMGYYEDHARFTDNASDYVTLGGDNTEE
mgnify:CR=1 FL=1